MTTCGSSCIAGSSSRSSSPRMFGAMARRRVADILDSEKADLCDREEGNGPLHRYFVLRRRFLCLPQWLAIVAETAVLRWKTLGSARNLWRRLFYCLFFIAFLFLFFRLSLISKHVNIHKKDIPEKVTITQRVVETG